MPKSSSGRISPSASGGNHKVTKPVKNQAIPEAIPAGTEREDLSQLSSSSRLNLLRTMKLGSVVMMLSLGFFGFGWLATLLIGNWSIPTMFLYTALVLSAIGVFLFTTRRGLPLWLKLSALSIEAALLIGSILVAGLNDQLIFSTLPLHIVIGQAQIKLRNRYALPLATIIWLMLVLLVFSSNNPIIKSNLALAILLVSLPALFSIMIARFIVREERQHYRLVEALTDLQRSEERYRQVTDRANDAIYILDSTGNFSFVNPKMCELSGQSIEYLLGRPFTSILNGNSRSTAQEWLKGQVKAGPDDMLQLEIVRPDGAKVMVEVNAAILPNPRGWVGVARDITERQRMRAQMEQRNRDLTALNAVISTANQSLELDKTLNNVVTTLVDVLGADVAGITLIEDEARLLKVGAYKGASDMVVRAVSPGTLKDGEGLTGEVAATGKPLLIADMTRDARVPIGNISDMGLRAFAAAPIKTRDHTIGVLSLISHQKNAFNQDDLNLLVSIGNGLAVAIENARLYGTSLNQVRELTCLADIASAINLSQSLGQTLSNIAESIGTNLGYRGCAIYLLDSSQHLVQAYGTHGLSAGLIEFISNTVNSHASTHDIDNWLMFRSLHSAEPVFSPISKDTFSSPNNPMQEVARQSGWNTVISVPLRLQGVNVGVIGCFSPEKSPPPESELRLLTTIANQTAIAVQNARLYREQQRRADQLRAVAELGRKIGSILSVNELLPFTTRLLQQTFDYYSVSICLVDPNEPEALVLKAQTGWHSTMTPQTERRLKMGEKSVITWVAEHGEPALLPDVSKDSRYKEYVEIGVVRSELTVPIRSGARVVGVLDIASAMPNGFDEVDLATMQAVAEQISIALDNARLYTELNRMVSQLKSGNLELEEATRHKSEFLANMSHELRTPLNAIIGFSEVLQDRVFGDLNDKQNRYVNNILTSGRHLLALVNDVLDLAKVEAGRMELHPEEFTPDEAIKDVEAIVSAIATKKKLSISNHFEANVKFLLADKSKFKQVLYNLLSNAVKFTPEGGSIKVTNQLVDAPRPGVKSELALQYIQVAVADTGIGIHQEDQPHIFEEFRQVDNSYSRQYQGTGLGLALSRRLVELHGGQLWVESEPGEGSIFTFTLPLEIVAFSPSNTAEPPADAIDRLLEAHAQTRLDKQVTEQSNKFKLTTDPNLKSALNDEPKPATSPQTHDSQQPTTKNGVLKNSQISSIFKTALVVEDDAKAAELLGLYLAEAGYRMERAYGGDTVLSHLEQMSQPPTLITMDVMLPNKNGWDVLRELKQHPLYKNVPVIIISLLDNPDMSRRLGAEVSLVKPIKKEDFLTALQRLEVNLATKV